MTDSQLELRPSRSNGAASAQPPLKVVGLFAGIGGIEEGLRRSGHQATQFCEIDPGARAVLSERFPEIPIAEDIRDYRQLPLDTDLITAGFPCQDLSQAGTTLGLDGERSSLIEEVFWLLRNSRQTEWVLLENVPFMIRLGGGKALETILKNLEDLGYHWAYRIVDTRAFGIPQRRKRVFILATQSHDPRNVLLVDDCSEPVESRVPGGAACGFYWTEGVRGLGWTVDGVPTLKGGSAIGIPSPPAVWHPQGGILRPGIGDAERLQGFSKGWTEPASEVVRPSMRWKLVGNAVTVDVAEWIGQRLRSPGDYLTHSDHLLKDGGKWPNAAYNVGEGRFASGVSTRPREDRAPPLVEFLDLDEAEPLSIRATSGFLRRFEASSLRKPEGFLEALHEHLAELESNPA